MAEKWLFLLIFGLFSVLSPLLYDGRTGPYGGRMGSRSLLNSKCMYGDRKKVTAVVRRPYGGRSIWASF